jgi:hypothetical protein
VGTYTYHIKVVPTQYTDRLGKLISTYQYSETNDYRDIPLMGMITGLPGEKLMRIPDLMPSY